MSRAKGVKEKPRIDPFAQIQPLKPSKKLGKTTMNKEIKRQNIKKGRKVKIKNLREKLLNRSEELIKILRGKCGRDPMRELLRIAKNEKNSLSLKDRAWVWMKIEELVYPKILGVDIQGNLGNNIQNIINIIYEDQEIKKNIEDIEDAEDAEVLET